MFWKTLVCISHFSAYVLKSEKVLGKGSGHHSDVPCFCLHQEF